VAVTEGSGVTFTVSLSAVSAQNVTVNYSTTNGTAGASDYTAVVGGSVTIVAGNLTNTVTINTTNDTLDENDGETFTVSLATPTNGIL